MGTAQAGRALTPSETAATFQAQNRRALGMFVVILVGLVAAVFAYRLGEDAQTSRIQASFERIAGERIAAVEAGLLTTIGSLRPLASFLNAAREPGPEEFQRFVAPLLASSPGIQAFEWVPVVENAERARFEAEAAREFPGFRIRDQNGQGMAVAAERARYYPVTTVEPLRGNEKIVGFDVASDPVRRAAIEAAVATRAPQASGRITLIQHAGDHNGFFVAYPVFDGSDRLRGLVLGVFCVEEAVNRLGSGADLSLSISDLAADPREAQMYPATPRGVSRPPAAVASSRVLSIGGRPWLVEAVATPDFLARETGRLPEVLLVAWLFLAGNIAWLVDRRYAVKAEVIARTADMRQARDEARRANRAKSDFLAAMSHEIRTPLIGVVALADHLLDQNLSPEHRQSLAIIARSGEHLHRMINDILDFSKLEAKQLTLEIRPFNPSTAARNVAALMERQAADKGLSLDVRIADDLPERVAGDPARLRQILLNLISNALKFTDSGGVHIEVSAESPQADGRRPLVFTVRDSGPGMSEATRAKLFTEFWQADSSIARRFGGTGLGLAISRRLAKRMDGDIFVVSAPGEGSAFTLRAPFAEIPAENAAQELGEERSAAPPILSNDLPAPIRLVIPPPAPDADQHDFSGRSILLAEDNPTNRAIAQTILARTGARVVEASDGAEALAKASCERFDLILMDVHMPNMTGLEAARAIRALPAPFGDTPIVALTASAFQEDRNLCAAAGMDDFLAKPYRGGPLRDVAARAMAAEPASASARGSTPVCGEPAAQVGAPAFAYDSFALLGAEVGPEDARDLLRDFMTDASARLEIIEAELRKGELGVSGREAHALKSSAATMGLARLAAIARELEAAARREDGASAETLGQAARAAFDEARPHVDEILSAA
ncbi:signal transduction histidine kinase/HPt (histidine-containing phosphotransfer) domain-containing protein/ActR/RegA family two-component response regulator [Rhodoblastus sphagnicola]|nr:CHASE domain-containing protein [Rhodoblastus sphagnicola]MBB4196549.1 signal transduction histidine kinase/HPt (histidine-containing phosphotransfer) domain-containing protein/ActR/RegA family two-component response regulator [Rhodoblastus sphagnicola]